MTRGIFQNTRAGGRGEVKKHTLAIVFSVRAKFLAITAIAGSQLSRDRGTPILYDSACTNPRKNDAGFSDAQSDHLLEITIRKYRAGTSARQGNLRPPYCLYRLLFSPLRSFLDNRVRSAFS